MTKPVVNDTKSLLEKIRTEAAFDEKSVLHEAKTCDIEDHYSISSFRHGTVYQHAKSQALIDKLCRALEVQDAAITDLNARRCTVTGKGIGCWSADSHVTLDEAQAEARRILSEGE